MTAGVAGSVDWVPGKWFVSDRTVARPGSGYNTRKMPNKEVTCQRQRLRELNEQMEDLYPAQILQRTLMM